MATVTLRPNGNGADVGADGTPVGAATGWECVDDVTSDGDTTYVLGPAATGVREEVFTIDSNSIGASDTINSVTVYGVASRTAARSGNSQMNLSIRENSVYTVGGTTHAMTTTYTTYSQTWTVRPSDSANFTKADIDSLEIGMKTNTPGFSQHHTTQVYAIIDYTPSGGGSSIKTVGGLAVASVKTMNALAIASVNSVNGTTNT
jgi:hypothetical protein